jgi:uncharacterized membrane protein
MPRHWKVYLLALSLTLCLSGNAQQENLTFTTIEPPGSNGTDSFAVDINSRGSIVGAYMGTDGRYHGFLRSEKGEFISIDFPGADFTRTAGINDQGYIVGMYRLPNDKRNVRHGFLRSRDGEFATIDPPGSIRTNALGINDHGDVVGRYCTVEGCAATPRRDYGFLLRDGVFTTIDVPGALATDPWKINSRGQIVGGYADMGGRWHVFLLSKEDFTTIDFPGAVETAPDADNGGINSHGDIAAYYCDDVPCVNWHGFLLSDGKFNSFDFPGAIQTYSFGINSSHDIVGGYTDASNNGHGFLLHWEGETDSTK